MSLFCNMQLTVKEASCSFPSSLQLPLQLLEPRWTPCESRRPIRPLPSCSGRIWEQGTGSCRVPPDSASEKFFFQSLFCGSLDGASFPRSTDLLSLRCVPLRAKPKAGAQWKLRKSPVQLDRTWNRKWTSFQKVPQSMEGNCESKSFPWFLENTEVSRRPLTNPWVKCRISLNCK